MKKPIDLTLLSPEPEETKQAVYKAVKTNDFGLHEDGVLVTGLMLKRHSMDGYSVLDDQLETLGSEAIVHLPKDGLIEGRLYESRAVNLSHDWETGYVDDWEVGIFEVTEDMK